MKSLNVQARATKILFSVLYKKNSLDDALSTAFKKESSNKGLIQELCYGTLRHYESLSYLLNQLLKKPFKKDNAELEVLLLLGLYQLRYLHFPPAVSVAETVNAVSQPWAKGLVNAILRNFLRQQETLLKEIDNSPVALYEHPQWMLSLWQKAFPHHWQSICHANNAHPPMTLRIHLAKMQKTDYLAQLTAKEIAFQDIPFLPSAVALQQPLLVEKLPGFHEGSVSVQDCGAQYTPLLLNLEENLSILDACSAPGGKLSHLLEVAPTSIHVTAIEINADRIERIKENLARLHKDKSVQLIQADILKPATWWNDQLFDRIIAHVPCSATGVIRRHPDIKRLRQEEDIAQLAKTQLNILNTLWSCLKVEGLLLYITCSICPEENDDVIGSFLATHIDATCLPLTQIKEGVALQYGHQLLPGLYPGDGFYYSLLKKSV